MILNMMKNCPILFAPVAELEYALVLGTSAREGLWVRLPPGVLSETEECWLPKTLDRIPVASFELAFILESNQIPYPA
jgi:hypothetical protein